MKCTELYSAQIQPDAIKLTEQHFTVEMDDVPNLTAKAPQEFLNADTAVKAQQSISGGGNIAFGGVHGFQTSGSN